MSGFADHFSDVAASYAEFRPRYPDALFSYLVAEAPSRDRAWDCATGNGQAATALAEGFREVIATDASEEQIRNAIPHPRVEYRVAPAERSGLKDGSIDLVTVAQALHWFDIPAFFAEARRVLRGRGLIAVWAYDHLEVGDEAVDGLLRHLYGVTVGPYWPPERQLVEEGYRSVAFPFAEMTPPRFAIEKELTLPALLGYLRTWSATRRYIAERGSDPVAELEPELREQWGEPNTPRTARWPIHLRLGRHLG